MTAHTTRRKIVHIVTKYVRDRYPRVLENDDVAEALGLTREQVRNCIRGYMVAHDDIVEDGPYRYVAVSPNKMHAAINRPISGAPTNGIINVSSGEAPQFRFLLVVQDGEVLLQDQDRNVWRATLL